MGVPFASLCHCGQFPDPKELNTISTRYQMRPFSTLEAKIEFREGSVLICNVTFDPMSNPLKLPCSGFIEAKNWGFYGRCALFRFGFAFSVVAEEVSEPLFDRLHRHFLSLGVVLDLLLCDLADSKVVCLWVCKVES